MTTHWLIRDADEPAEPQAGEVLCAACEGRGWHQCPRAGGAGTGGCIEGLLPCPVCGDELAGDDDCQRCDGTGMNPCPACNGGRNRCDECMGSGIT